VEQMLASTFLLPPPLWPWQIYDVNKFILVQRSDKQVKLHKEWSKSLYKFGMRSTKESHLSSQLPLALSKNRTVGFVLKETVLCVLMNSIGPVIQRVPHTLI